MANRGNQTVIVELMQRIHQSWNRPRVARAACRDYQSSDVARRRPTTSAITNDTRNTATGSWAVSVAAAAIPPNPNRRALMATRRNSTAHGPSTRASQNSGLSDSEL